MTITVESKVRIKINYTERYPFFYLEKERTPPSTDSNHILLVDKAFLEEIEDTFKKFEELQVKLETLYDDCARDIKRTGYLISGINLLYHSSVPTKKT